MIDSTKVIPITPVQFNEEVRIGQKYCVPMNEFDVSVYMCV